MEDRTSVDSIRAVVSSIPPRIVTLSAALALFLINVWLCRGLFHVEFTQRMESIEGSYMSISRWAMDHWGETWFPLWFSGTPFHRVYQPGLHLTVAAWAKLMGWTAQHSYHFLTAIAYCLGVVTFFWLCRYVTGSSGYAFCAGLIYSLISPTSLLVRNIRFDTGHLVTARRFIVLVRYGEGPHISALMLLPLVVLAVHLAVTERKWWAVAAAPLSLAALVLTNWPGTMGLTLALAAYFASRLGSKTPVHWPLTIALASIAYLIACPWIPPSIIAAVQLNARQSDATVLGHGQLYGFLALFAAALCFHALFQRFKTDPWLRFFVYFTLITCVISIGREWYNWRLLPQPNRFQLEFEMAFAGLIAWFGKLLYDRSPRFARVALVTALVVFCALQGARFRKFAAFQVLPIDIAQTIEYRMAKWFDSHMDGRRVFAPGNVSLWMNMFTDTPQMAGCCDQGMPSNTYRHVIFAIYTGQNAGTRDAAVSVTWFKAYGVDAAGVSGPMSTEFFHPFAHPEKFDGVLPVLWREGDNAVYAVERRSQSLAHVITRAQMVSRPPENGLDTDQAITYVDAIEAPDAPKANFQWLGGHHARIDAAIAPHQLVSVQISYDPGWSATVMGNTRPVFPDGLGLLVIDPQCEGACSIDLNWDGGAEAKWARAAMLLGLLLLGALPWWLRAKWRKTPDRAALQVQFS